MMQIFLKSIAIRLRLSRYPRGQSHTAFIDPFFQNILESICVFSLEALKSDLWIQTLKFSPHNIAYLSAE